MVEPAELHKMLAAASKAVPTADALRGVMNRAAEAGGDAARRRNLSVRVSLDVSKGLTLRFAGAGAKVAREAALKELERALPQASSKLRQDLIQTLEA